MSSSSTTFLKVKGSDRYHIRKTHNGKIVSPGTLQYKVTKEEIKTFDFENINEDKGSWVLEENTEENLERLTPNTTTAKLNNWKLCLVIKSSYDGGFHLKGALQNTSNPNEFALMTAMDSKSSPKYEYRTLLTLSKGGCTICFCKMMAPHLFWSELKIRVNNMEKRDKKEKSKNYY